MNNSEFNIPCNYKEPGYVFKGMVPLRNFIDAVVLAFLGFLISSIFAPEDFWDAISWYILGAGFPAVFGIVGINSIPLSTYLLDVIMWSKRRDPYFFNHHGSAYSSSAADVMLDTPQLRDHLASAYDFLQKKLTPKQIDFIEGETFQFADDPELAFLQNAEETEEEKEEPKTMEPAKSTEPAEHPAVDTTERTDALDFDKIIDGITLTDNED